MKKLGIIVFCILASNANASVLGHKRQSIQLHVHCTTPVCPYISFTTTDFLDVYHTTQFGTTINTYRFGPKNYHLSLHKYLTMEGLKITKRVLQGQCVDFFTKNHRTPVADGIEHIYVTSSLYFRQTGDRIATISNCHRTFVRAN